MPSPLLDPYCIRAAPVRGLEPTCRRPQRHARSVGIGIAGLAFSPFSSLATRAQPPSPPWLSVFSPLLHPYCSRAAPVRGLEPTCRRPQRHARSVGIGIAGLASDSSPPRAPTLHVSNVTFEYSVGIGSIGTWFDSENLISPRAPRVWRSSYLCLRALSPARYHRSAPPLGKTRQRAERCAMERSGCKIPFSPIGVNITDAPAGYHRSAPTLGWVDSRWRWERCVLGVQDSVLIDRREFHRRLF